MRAYGLLLGLALFAGTPVAVAQIEVQAVPAMCRTTFFYQADLRLAGAAVSDEVDLEFRLFADELASQQTGPTLYTDSCWLDDGTFVAELDFGIDLADGVERWIELTVNGLPLWPREPISTMLPTELLPTSVHGAPQNAGGLGDPADDATSIDSQRSELERRAPSPRRGGPAVDQDVMSVDVPVGIDQGVNDAESRDPGGGSRAGGWTVVGNNIYYTGGNVGIGVTNPLYALDARSGGSRVISALNTALTGYTYGVFGVAKSSSGAGIMGYASSSSGQAYGIYGLSNANLGRGVVGYAGADSDQLTIGVWGRSRSTGGAGVVGANIAATGHGTGVYGTVASPDAYAGFFEGGRNYMQGYLGLGTLDPQYQLDVNGTINASAILINGTPGGDITGVYPGPGLIGGGSSGEVTLSLDPIYADARYVNENQSAGGDLVGSFPSPTVIGLRGRSVSSTAPSPGQVLEWNGSAWAPATDDTGGGGASDHGQLSGLSDDDHPQYLPVSRGASEATYAGRFNIQQSAASSRIVNFYNSSGTDIGHVGNQGTASLYMLAKNSPLQLRAAQRVDVLNEGASAYIPIWASEFHVSSTAALKENIAHLPPESIDAWLEVIARLRPATYHRVGEPLAGSGSAAQRPLHLGFIAEEMPSQLLSPEGGAVDLYALTTALAASVQALNTKNNQLTERIAQQDAKLADLRERLERLEELLGGTHASAFESTRAAKPVIPAAAPTANLPLGGRVYPCRSSSQAGASD